MNQDNTLSQMKKGLLEMCILSIANKKDVYASDILEELKRSELIVVEGTLYPLLSRLKNTGLLEYYWEESRTGPPRKYYRITDIGKETLQALLVSWQTLVSAVGNIIEL
ncbi:MAG: PadR family transcriptional regulator [Bacteroidales bacterium]|nr:PadR family transcriptional regulator [Bacteroidales bacterium]